MNLVIKFILFFLNFAIFLLSGAVTGLMIWILTLKQKKVSNAYDFFLDPACVLCLVGSVAVFVSFFGWFGSLREHIVSLNIYKWTMTLLFLVEMVFIVLIFVIVYVPDARAKLKIYPEDTLSQAIDKYRDDEDMQNLIDSIQKMLKCCGTSNDDNGYQDWKKNPYFNCSSTGVNFGESCSVPFSCCKDTNTGLVNYMCGKDMLNTGTSETQRSQTIYTTGCLKAITSLLESNVLVVGGVIIGIIIPQIILTNLTSRLIGQIKIQMSKWNSTHIDEIRNS